MPDVNIFQDPKAVGGMPLIPQAQPSQTPDDSKLQLAVKPPAWLATNAAQTPYKTQLSQTLRYTDPAIGYNPFDTELEYKYADAHPGPTFRNNVLQGLAKLTGTFAEAFATIPMAITATAKGDFSQLYDNSLTNSIQDWYDNLETSLPTYKNKNQTEHPVLSWFSTDVLNNIGGAVNNLGFTAGAILGTVAEGAVITALTGGTGTLPAVGANITRWFGRFGRAVAASTESAAEMGNIARLAEGAANTERGLIVGERGLVKAEQGLSRHVGTGIPNEFAAGINATRNATVNSIDKGLNSLYKLTKFTDGVKYNLALLTSAMAEGSFEANSVYRNVIDQSKKSFYEKNGYDPKANDIKDIEKLAHTAGDFTMGANIAILYASNRINWGSLFKPTTQTVIAGSLPLGYRSFGKVLNKETGLYELLDKTPQSRLGKALLYMTQPSKAIQRDLVESAEEGAQFIVSEGAGDYAKRKYDGTNRGELADYIKSFNYGVLRTFKSNEGLENLVGGFVGGIMGGFLFSGANKVRGIKNMSAKQRLQFQIDGLNKETFKNIFEHHIAGAAAQQSIANDYNKAVQAGDIFSAKNLKAEMMHNWVNGAVKTNSFDARLDEIEAAKGLKGEEFSKLWGGLEYNEDNRQDAVNYLDGIKQRALGVKNDILKIDRLFQGNPFNKKTQTVDYLAHESWKEALARNLGFSRNYQERITQLATDINKAVPGLNINDAINLTSKKGISSILDRMSKAMDSLAKSERDAEGAPELQQGYREKAKQLGKLFNEMQQHVFNNFEAKNFVPTLRKMYNLLSGGSMENNNYLDQQKQIGEANTVYIGSNQQKEAQQQIDDDAVVDVFERLIDTSKLHGVNYQAVYAYNSLLKPRGAKKYSEYVKALINKTNSNITVTDAGTVETPVNTERQAEEDARLATDHMTEEDNITPQQREQMNDIIMKEAAGESLTPEEQEILDTHPLYTEKAKTKEAIKTAILKEKGVKPTTTATSATQVKNYVEDESGFRKEVSPVELLNKINSHEKVGKDANKNLFKAIFSKVNNFLNSGLTAKLTTSDYQMERPKGVQQTYTPIALFDKNGNKTGNSGIYKARYERNIEIHHNGEMIGLLKPADSLFLDAQGQRSIYEMTEAEFTDVTGMPRNEYKAYMKELNAYKKAYDGLLAEMSEGSSVDNKTVLKYFPEVRVNFGNTVFNSGTNKEGDTLIKDLSHRPIGTSVLSYKNENGYRKVTIVNERELAANNPAYYNKLKAFIATDAFKAQAQQTQGRYILAVPVNGEYTTSSLIYSRPAEINDEYKQKLVDTLKNNLGKEQDPEYLDELNYVINSTYYIANADRSVKGTTIDLLVNEDGSFSIQIQNNEKGTAYNNTLNIADAKIDNYEDIIKTIQQRINDEERLDRNLQKLKITLKQDSIKFQTLNDRDVYSMKDIEDKIKVATSPNVFENYSVNMYPKGSTKGEPRQTTKTKAASATQKQAIIDAVKALKPVQGKITNIDINMINNDPEEFLQFIAEQAELGNEASLRARYGDTIVDGAKQLFPAEPIEEVVPKTPEELEAERQFGIKQQRGNQIDREYTTKKAQLHEDFVSNLTEAGSKVKDFIKNNPIFVGKEVADVYGDIAKGAGVTAKDVTDYLHSVRIHNIQRAKLEEIQQSKKDSDVVDNTSQTIFANNQAETSIILQDLFNLPKEQADATAAIYERNREAWVKTEYDNELAYRKANNGNASAKYSVNISNKQLTKIEAELQTAKDKLAARQEIASVKLRDLDKIIVNDQTKEKDLNKAITQKQSEEATLKVLSDEVAILEQQVANPTKALYGADLLDYINKQSYTRFSFGKATENSLTNTSLTQNMTTAQIKTKLETDKVIEINCK